MKTTRTHSLIQGTLAAALAGLITFTSVPAKAAHEQIYAVDQNNILFDFYSDAPGTILNQYGIAGLQFGESIVGLDYWGGTLYGLGSLSRLYVLTVNNNVAQAAQVGGVFVPGLNGATFGVDNEPAGFRVVSGLTQSLLVNRGTAVVTPGPNLNYVAGDPFFGVAPRVDAIAYDYATGNWYAGDTLQNTLAIFTPATGGLSTIGAMGMDPSRFNGLDISPFTGIMYMDTPAASSDPQANLYTINKATGFATLVGQIGNPGDDILVRALTVVPEPSSVVLVALGVSGLVCARRRRR
jgi:hypothetical protein